MYTKRKNFIFHNKKAVAHIESQRHQSYYIESLVIQDLDNEQQPNVNEVIQLLKKQLNKEFDSHIDFSKEENNELKDSISNLLEL